MSTTTPGKSQFFKNKLLFFAFILRENLDEDRCWRVYFINLKNIFSVLSHEYDEMFYVWNPRNCKVQVEAAAQGQPWLHRDFEACTTRPYSKRGGGGEREKETLYLVISLL